MRYLFALLLITTLACSDDAETLTAGQRNAATLSKLVNENNLTTATVFQSSIKLYGPESFKIDDNFIVVGTTYFSLEKLLGFELFVTTGQRTLVLYFE
jgi:hypothetical protein